MIYYQLDPEARGLAGPTHGWLLTQPNTNDQPIGFSGFGRQVFIVSLGLEMVLETGSEPSYIASYGITSCGNGDTTKQTQKVFVAFVRA